MTAEASPQTAIAVLTKIDSRVSSILSLALGLPNSFGSDSRNPAINTNRVDFDTSFSARHSLAVMSVDRNGTACPQRIDLISSGVIVTSILVVRDNRDSYRPETVDAAVLALSALIEMDSPNAG